MRQLHKPHILLFRLLRDHFLFLTRRQIERVLTLATRSANRDLEWLVSEKYLARRYRADSFGHFQTPVYYLGPLGWHLVGKTAEDYKEYRRQIVQRAERQMDHELAVSDVFLRLILESNSQSRGRVMLHCHRGRQSHETLSHSSAYRYTSYTLGVVRSEHS